MNEIQRLNPILAGDDGNKSAYGYGAWIIFDGITTSSMSESLTGIAINLGKGENYIGYNFKKRVTLTHYVIYPWFYSTGTTSVNSPTGWTLQGSVNGVDWVDIHRVSGLETRRTGAETHYLQVPAQYSMFRLNNVEAVGSAGFYEVEFWGLPYISKHLIKSSSKIHTLSRIEYSDNLIPMMTSNTLPSDVASASNFYGSGYEPFRAFNGLLSNSTMFFINSSNPTEEQFKQWGMNALEGYENEIDKVAYEMEEDDELGEGRVVRKKINKNDFKINRLEVK